MATLEKIEENSQSKIEGDVLSFLLQYEKKKKQVEREKKQFQQEKPSNGFLEIPQSGFMSRDHETLLSLINNYFSEEIKTLCTEGRAARKSLDESVEILKIPNIMSFYIPYLTETIQPESFKRENSLGLAYQFQCESIPLLFEFQNEKKESYIIDKKVGKKWKIFSNAFPQFQDSKGRWKTPQPEVYQKICEKYKHFMDDYWERAYFESWPRDICIPHYFWDEKNKILTDILQGERWKFIESGTFPTVRSNVGKGWFFPSERKLTQFFQNYDKYSNDFNHLILSMWFWTRTEEGERMISVLLNNDKLLQYSNKRRSETAFGLMFQEI